MSKRMRLPPEGWRRSSLTGLALLALAVLAAAPASASDEFGTLKALIEKGQYRNAVTLASQSPGGPATRALAVQFTGALIFKHEGHLREAAARMRTILARHPAFSRVRQELADTLFLMGDYAGAQHHFRRLLESTRHRRMRRLYRRLLAEIRRQKPWQFSFAFSIAPSTNINNGVDSSTVVIGGVPFLAASNQRKSGIGLRFGAAARYHRQFWPHWGLEIGGDLHSTLYRLRGYDQILGTAYADLVYRMFRCKVSGGIVGDREFYGMRPYFSDYGPRLSVDGDLGRAGTLSATLDHKRLFYDSTSAMNGTQTDLALSLRHAINSASLWDAGIESTDVTARTSFNAYRAVQASLDYTTEMASGIIADAGAAYQWRNYVGDFPLTGRPRRDRTLSLHVGATLRKLDFGGLSPHVEVDFARDHSNVELFAYHFVSLDFSLTRVF